ncbi:MAG TPA: putative sulfate exporter family transporter, partial [Gemmatimonadaceae bacterium]|nr:putative sulfate exporter family transporter [Gemmatimonadaceae bacterium]
MTDRTVATSLDTVAGLVPGLALAGAVALVARVVAGSLPPAFGEILVAVLLGIAVANVVTIPSTAMPGIRFAVQRVLRGGIILLGARLSLGAVLAIGAGVLGLVLVSMTVAFAVALL